MHASLNKKVKFIGYTLAIGACLLVLLIPTAASAIAQVDENGNVIPTEPAAEGEMRTMAMPASEPVPSSPYDSSISETQGFAPASDPQAEVRTTSVAGDQPRELAAAETSNVAVAPLLAASIAAIVIAVGAAVMLVRHKGHRQI